jgi:beta-phosphoglucomutase family hydrolase
VRTAVFRPPGWASARLGAVVFDLDGVLADSESLHVEAWKRLFADLGVAFESGWAAEWVGVPDVQISRFVAERFSPGRPAAELLEQKRRRFRELVRRELRSFPGVAAELRSWRAISLAVATSSARAEAELMLQSMGLRELFPVVVAGDEVQHRKPAPDIYRQAAQQLGLAAAECLAVEDSPVGIQAARAAGMPVIAVATSFAADRLREAERVFPTPVEAIRWARARLEARGG